jgi:signal recognition particle subunit SEC65
MDAFSTRTGYIYMYVYAKNIAVAADSSKTVVNASREIGRLKGNLKRLWELSKQSPLDRNNCKDVLLEIRKSLRLLLTHIQDIILESLEKLEPTEYTLFTILIGKTPEEWVKEIFRMPNIYESDISTIISFLDHPEHYKDEDIKDKIVSLVEHLEVSISKLERQLGLKQGIVQISEFLSTFPQFTENWSIAVCYLTAMEIAVKNKLKELGLMPTGEFEKDAVENKLEEQGQEPTRGFKKHYEDLLKYLKNKGIEVSELERQLPKIFWDIRNKVVHEGYSPSFEELEIITKYIEKLLALLTSSK